MLRLSLGTRLHRRWRKEVRLELTVAPTLEQTVGVRYEAGRSQRAIARELNIDRRKVKRILDQAA